MGVTEAAVYRHYRSKEELIWQAYKRIVEEMIREMEHLAFSTVLTPNWQVGRMSPSFSTVF